MIQYQRPGRQQKRWPMLEEHLPQHELGLAVLLEKRTQGVTE
jgi:hypothetical protein